MWMENFQMFKLDLERAENQIWNCQNPLDHWQSKSVPEKKSVKQQRHYFANKGPSSQSYDFSSSSVWMWELDYKASWAAKNNAFELWCLRRLLRVPWTVSRSNQSFLKEIRPEYLLEGLRLKLKLQYFGHMMWRNNWLENTVMLGKIEGWRQEEKGTTENEMFG